MLLSKLVPRERLVSLVRPSAVPVVSGLLPRASALSVRYASSFSRSSSRDRPAPVRRQPAFRQEPPSASNNTEPSPEQQQPQQQQQQQHQASAEALEEAQRLINLPVVIPQSTSAIIQPDSPSSALLIQPALVIQRQIELMNVMIGFEQANKYAVCDAAGTTLGYIAEEDHSFAKSMTRQLLRTHRPFKAYVVDTSGRVVLKIERPFTLINSRVKVYAIYPEDEVPQLEQQQQQTQGQITAPQTHEHAHGATAANATSTAIVPSSTATSASSTAITQADYVPPEMRNNALEGMAEVLIGEIHQIWHPWRRKYELFVGDTQFASIDAPLLSWNFDLQDEHGRTIGSVDKQFTAWLREIFTDTSAYVLRLDAAQQPGHLETPLENQVNATGGGEGSIATRGLTLDERAVLLASAMTIDTDYFSRHSNSSGIVSPVFMPMPGSGGGAPAPVPNAPVPPTPGAPADATTAATADSIGSMGSQSQSSSPSDSPFLSDSDSGVSSPSDGGFLSDDTSKWESGGVSDGMSEEGGGIVRGIFDFISDIITKD